MRTLILVLSLVLCPIFTAGCATNTKTVTRFSVTGTHQDGKPDTVATSVGVEFSR